MKIRHKITFLAALPLAAIFAFAALAVVTTGGEAMRADQLRRMVTINAEIGELVSALQAERSAAVQIMTGDDDASVSAEYRDRIDKTDTATDDYHAARSAAGTLPDGVGGLLDEAETNLERLESTRETVINGAQTSAAVAFAYRIPIADLLEFRESVPQAGGASSRVGDMIRASTILLQSGEHQSLEGVAVLRAIDNGPLSELHYAQIVESGSTSDDMRLSFNDLADRQWRGWLEKSRDGSEMIAAHSLGNEAAGTPPGKELAIGKSEWVDRIDFLTSQRRELQSRIDESVVGAVSDVRADQLWWTGGQIVAVLATVILMVLMALRLGSPVVRGLRKLSDAARYVAGEGLPKAVEQLDDHEKLGDRTPEEFAKDVDPPIDIQGRDELADVGRAFNEVHEVAVRVAATQALLRLHIGAMFVRLARRGHSLTGRLTSVLDDAERNEDDPQRLERLFALDHLVTLSGRANDSLLVLGGAASSKVRRSGESVRDVLTAAQGQIEQYTRVNITKVDTDIGIGAGTVDDVVKLLAELLENATQFSQRPVEVCAWKLTDRLIVQVIDDGIGIDPTTLEKLNTRIASKSPLDLESVQTMGLTVVSHLAARYDISVELRAIASGGIMAEVTVPPNLLVNPSEVKQQAEAAAPSNGPALFDKTKKSENRRRYEAVWRQRFQGDSPSWPPTDTGTTTAAEPLGSSLGSVLLPAIHFDAQSGPPTKPPPRPPHGPDNQPATAPRQPNRPAMFQPENKSRNRPFTPSGWTSAQAAAETAAAAANAADGLPKREPMAQLVPGGMETRTEDSGDVARNPDLVSATYVAFARGRASGRIENAASDRPKDAQ